MAIAENFLNGARMARQIAAEYRRDAQNNDIPPHQRESWLRDAERAEERADWYENHARHYQ